MLYAAVILYTITIILLIKKNQRLNDEISRLKQVDKNKEEIE